MSAPTDVDPEADYGGSGPGARSADGCSVELYRRTPYAGELEGLLAWLRPGVRVLELGCGTGRLTRRLLELGCEVTAVDNSAEMLAQAPEAAKRVQADIETLRLAGPFDLVLLPSGLINHGDAAVRRLFLAAAARHVAPGAPLLLKRQDARWVREATVGPAGRSGDLALSVLSVERQPGADGERVAMTLAYTLGEDRWTHHFVITPLDDADVDALLGAAGFDTARWIDDARLWAEALRR